MPGDSAEQNLAVRYVTAWILLLWLISCMCPCATMIDALAYHFCCFSAHRDDDMVPACSHHVAQTTHVYIILYSDALSRACFDCLLYSGPSW